MGNVTLFLMFLCVVPFFVQGFPKPDEDEHELIELLRKTLSYYGSPRGRPGKGPARPGTSKGDGIISKIDVSSADIEDFEHLFRFPGSDFMTRMLGDWLEEDLPSDVSGIKDTIELNKTALSSIEAVLSPLLKVVGDDTDSFAEIMARFLTRAVFVEHVKCPSSLLNKFMAKMWKENATALKDEKSDLYQLFDSAIDKFFPTFSGDPDLKKQIVTEMVKRTRDVILDDTEELILSLGFLDVAKFGNAVYERFQNYTESMDFTQTVKELVDKGGVACRDGTELFGYHNFAAEMFLSEFKVDEEDSVTEEIGEILLDNLKRTLYAKTDSFDDDMLDTVEWDIMSTMVDGVIAHIDDKVIPDIEHYIDVITNKKTEELLRMFKFLDEGKKSILTEVLKRLGWPDAGESTVAVPSPSDSPVSAEGTTKGERMIPDFFFRRRYPNW